MLRHARTHVQTCTSYGTRKDCPSQSKKKCPFWIEGRHLGKRWHQSLKTSNEKTAIRLVNRVIETGKLEGEPTAKGIGVAEAVQRFLTEETARGAAPSTLKSWRKFLVGSPTRHGWTDNAGVWHKRKNAETFSATLIDFCTAHGIASVDEFTPHIVAMFRQSWTVSRITSEKQSERLKGFFRFCVDMKWIERNPTEGLKPPVGVKEEVPVIPSTPFRFVANEIG